MSDNDKGDRGITDVSRRGLIKRAGLASVGAALSSSNVVPAAAAEIAPAPRREALETLNATEADTLDAIVARLIPTDENGPGATEARAALYIDHALAGPLRPLRALTPRAWRPWTSMRSPRRARVSPSSLLRTRTRS